MDENRSAESYQIEGGIAARRRQDRLDDEAEARLRLREYLDRHHVAASIALDRVWDAVQIGGADPVDVDLDTLVREEAIALETLELARSIEIEISGRIPEEWA